MEKGGGNKGKTQEERKGKIPTRMTSDHLE